MTEVTEVESYIQHCGQAVTGYLSQVFRPSQKVPVRLFEAMNYSLLAGGKRIRPVLCIATAHTLGVPEETSIPVAAAIEMIHAYSLIHDDLPCMDDDDLRRGKPTNHKVFGEAAALLAGDALLTYAFEQLSHIEGIDAKKQLACVHILSHASGCFGMVGGQFADVESDSREGSLADLVYIQSRKTAMLIQASVLMGATLGEVSSEVREHFGEFGWHLGLAFQIVDDLLDVLGTEELTGKTVGTDERLHKLTYPSMVGVEETKRRADEEYDLALSALAASRVDAPLLVSLANRVLHRNA